MEHPSGHESTPEEDAFTRLVLLVFRLNGLLLEAGDRIAAPPARRVRAGR